MKTLFFVSLILCLSFHSKSVLAWGQTGHRTVGLIAQKHLSNKAKKRISQILHHESLGMCSTWMDEIKSDSSYDHTHTWHYVTIPTGQNYAACEKNPKGDAIKAINEITRTLKSGALDQAEEVRQLRFLVHLVGDIHQPLHVGNGEDRGGNDIKLKFFWKDSNLHRIWDSGMIDKKQLSYTELAAAIDHVHKEDLKAWQSQGVEEWAKESMALRARVYDLPSDNNVRYRYMYTNFSIVKRRLVQAGIRLAGLLNEIYG